MNLANIRGMTRARAPRVRSMGCAVFGLSVWVWAVPAMAQDSPPPATDSPANNQPAAQPPTEPAPVDSESERMRRRKEAAEDALKPASTSTTPVAPDATVRTPVAPPSSIPVPTTRRAREGVFIVKQRGELMVARTGDVIFIPDKGAPARANRPMVLLPSQALARLESAAGMKAEVSGVDSPLRQRVVLSGQVTVYRQREYLMPTVFQIGFEDPEAPVAVPPKPEPVIERHLQGAGAETDLAVKPSNGDGDVETLIQELEDRRTRNRGLTRDVASNVADSREPTGGLPPGSSPETPAGSETGVTAANDAGKSWPMPEGAVITARRARMVRLSDGAAGISFDNGANPAPGARRVEAPMALLPCQLTQRMEEVIGGRGERAVVEISGRVFTYAGRNYVLPTMYQVLPPSDVGPLD